MIAYRITSETSKYENFYDIWMEVDGVNMYLAAEMVTQDLKDKLIELAPELFAEESENI